MRWPARVQFSHDALDVGQRSALLASYGDVGRTATSNFVIIAALADDEL